MSQRVVVCLGSREYNVELNGNTVLVDGKTVTLDHMSYDAHCGLEIHSNNRILRAVVEQGTDGGAVLFQGRELTFSYETERQRLLKRFASIRTKAHSHADLKASMPGMVVRVLARPGDSVQKGDAILILEAMKMENEVRAPIDAVVREIRVVQGQAVEKGDVLALLEA